MAWGTMTESALLTVDANSEFFTDGTDAIVIALNPGESASLVFNAGIKGTTDDLIIEVLQGHRIVNDLGLDAASSGTSLDLNTVGDALGADDEANGTYLIMTSGGEQGEGRLITDSTAANDRVTLQHALSGTPSASETYSRYRFHAFQLRIDPDSTTPDDEKPHALGVSLHASQGQYVAARAKSAGSTDAHVVSMSYQTDGVSV